MISKGLQPSSQTFNAILAVVGAHGDDDDLLEAMRLMRAFTTPSTSLPSSSSPTSTATSLTSSSSSQSRPIITPTTVTYNILLNFCVTKGCVSDSLAVMQLMKEGYRNVAKDTRDRGGDNLADRFTYNTLMKLCVQVTPLPSAY